MDSDSESRWKCSEVTICSDQVCGFFRDHHTWCVGVPGDLCRHDARVCDPEPDDTPDSELWITDDHGILLRIATHLAGRDRMAEDGRERRGREREGEDKKKKDNIVKRKKRKKRNEGKEQRLECEIVGFSPTENLEQRTE